MAKAETNHRYLASMLVVFLLLTSSTSSSARPFTGNYFSLALPSDRVMLPETPSTCGHKRTAGKQPIPVTRLAGGKHMPLILNMLPKGPVPPSGPSKGTNNHNN